VAHGRQQLCLFNAHYDEHCFLPIHVYDTERSRPVAVDRALLAQAQRAGATTFEQTSLADAARTKSGWNLSMRSARGVRALFCNFIVDATGRTSVFARRQGVTWQRFGDLIAAAGRLRTADPCIPDDLTLRVSACEHGWWSMAPTPDGAIVATFYGSAETKRAMRISEREWWQWGLACSPNMRAILKDSAAEPDEVCIYPAFPRLLRRMQGRHWFAIGDAAASHDPLSGHGILYAFESAFRAAEMVSANIPVEQIGPIYQEAITARFAHHIAGRRAAYAEAEHLFPASRFWMAMTEEPTSGGEA
jgi:flavin-dependent dehydrogenase